MSMVANSYLTSFNNLGQPEIVAILSGGFTGTIRAWWDKHLTTELEIALCMLFRKMMLSLIHI